MLNLIPIDKMINLYLMRNILRLDLTQSLRLNSILYLKCYIK